MDKYSFTVLEQTHLHPFVKKALEISFIFVVIIIALLFLPWQQTVQGSGVLIALNPQERDYQILAPIDGFVEKYEVNETDKVQAKTILLNMVDLDSNYLHKLSEQENILQQRFQNAQDKKSSLEERRYHIQTEFDAQVAVYKEKQKQLEKRIQSLQYKQIASEKNKEIENANYNRVKLLYGEGIESKRDFEKIAYTHAKATLELQKVHLDIEIEKNNRDILKEEYNQLQAKNKNLINALENQILSEKNNIKNIEHALQNAKLALSRYESATIKAKTSGTIVRLLQNDTNRFIAKNTPLIHFAPDVKERTIKLKVSDFNMPLIKVGLKVRIKFYGWPALQISGWPEIKFGTFGGVIKQIEVLSHEKGFYYAYVVEDPNEPWPDETVLRIGTQAAAWVRLDVVTVWYEMWRLMNALPPQMISERQNLNLIERF